MEPVCSLPFSQQPATCLYPKTDQSIFLQFEPSSMIFLLIFCYHLCLGLSSILFPLVSSTKILCIFLSFPVRAMCPTHLLLDFTSVALIGDDGRLCSLSSRIFFSVFYYLLPLSPKYFPQHPIPNTLGLCYSLNVSDQFSPSSNNIFGMKSN